jgi:hypothetical protein
MLVHRLVVLSFYGIYPGKPYVRHLNGNSLDNRFENLFWGTAYENYLDMVKHGTKRHVRGEFHPNAKLDRIAVLDIRDRRNTSSYLVKRYGVSKSTIDAVRSGKVWGHV